MNRKRYGPRWRPPGEKDAFAMLAYMKKLHTQQRRLQGRSHHEQSAKSRAPSNGGEWPWAISSGFEENTVTVAACAVRCSIYYLAMPCYQIQSGVVWGFENSSGVPSCLPGPSGTNSHPTQVGMVGKDGSTPVAKEWRIETTSRELLSALAPYRCSGGHRHVHSLGKFLSNTACYPTFLAKLVAHVLLANDG